MTPGWFGTEWVYTQKQAPSSKLAPAQAGGKQWEVHSSRVKKLITRAEWREEDLRGKHEWMWPRVQPDVWGNLKCECSRHAWPDATQISNPITVQLGPLGWASAGSNQHWAIAEGTEGLAQGLVLALGPGLGLAMNSWVMMMHKMRVPYEEPFQDVKTWRGHCRHNFSTVTWHPLFLQLCSVSC